MDALFATSLSGMQAARVGLDVAASNIANGQTPGFHRQQAVATAASPGVSASVRTATDAGHAPEEDMVGLLASRDAFLANLAVFRTASTTTRSLLDVLA